MLAGMEEPEIGIAASVRYFPAAGVER